MPLMYVGTFIVLAAIALGGVWRANQNFAPEMYQQSGPKAFAKAFARGENYAVFDLNINIREMRDYHIASMKSAPEVAVLGASHWQEAHTELLPDFDFYNAHVHRDYYEDMLAVVEIFERHKKLPKKMIVAIRDRLFTPVADRTDFLWLPGIPYYETMARKLGIQPHPYWETAPVQRWRELLSTSMLFTNVSRWFKAPVKPHATMVDHHETLDTLRPGGSIYWSAEHQRLFTAKRSARLSKEFAEANFASPPKIDPKGLATLDRLFRFLKEKGVEVYLVHPPFNPLYYDAIKGGPYHRGLAKIETITQNYAEKYGWQVFGSFDPAKVGCTADMYIDAEHSDPVCLGKLLAQFAAIAKPDKEPADRSPIPAKPAPAQQKPVASLDPGTRAPAPAVVAASALSPAGAGGSDLEDNLRIAKRDDLLTPDDEPPEVRNQTTNLANSDPAPAAAPSGSIESGRQVPMLIAAESKAPTVRTADARQADASLPPLPVQKFVALLPPLPTKRPMIGAVDCVWPGIPHHVSGNPTAPKRAVRGGARS